MRFFRACLTVLIFSILAAVPLAHAQKRVALVIGNSAYQHTPTLKNPVNDAADLGAALKKHGFHVMEGFNLNKADFDRKICDFVTALNGASAGVFFYAGHGLQVAGHNYLVPIDAKAEAADALEFEMVRVDTIHRVMERQTNTNILFLDACRDNPLARNLARSMGTRSLEIGRGLARTESGVGTLISFSTQPGNVALDGLGRNSPFAEALVTRISSANDDLNGILISVRNDVMKATQEKQIPWDSSALTGRFYFNQAAQRVTEPNDNASARLSEAAEAWSAIRDTKSISSFEAYIARFKDSFYAELARERIEDLKRQASTSAKSDPVAPKSVEPSPSPALQYPNVAARPSPAPQEQMRPSSPTPQDHTDITIGLAGPMTGGEAAFGRQFKNGAEQAIADINAAGGVLGRQLKLEIGDDACVPTQARFVADKLAGMKLPFVAGHYCSSSSIPASEVYAKSGTLQITPASTNPLFTERGLWNTFRVSGRDEHQGVIAGNYIARNFMRRNVAILHDKTTYGKGLADETKNTMNKAGLTERLYESFNRKDKDFTTLVSTLKRNKIDVVYIGGYHQEVGLILRQMRAQGVNAVMLAGDALADSEFPLIAGSATAGTLFTFGPDPRRAPAAGPIVAKFRAKNIDPDGYTLYTYAAIQVWAQAATGAGSVDGRTVAGVLKSSQL